MPATALKIKPEAENTAAATPAPVRKRPAKPAPKLAPSAVLAYLKANPQFFAKNREELQNLVPAPKKGRMAGNILSLHALKAEKIARQAEKLRTRQKQLISMAKGNAAVAQTIFTAVVALTGCRTLPQLRKYLQTGLAKQLDLTVARLYQAGESESATSLTAGQIHTFCPQPITLQPLDAALHRPLFGPKTNNIKSVCLMALTAEDGTYLGLLAMGSSEATRFHAGQATDLAEFLRQVTGSVLKHAR